MGGDGKEGEEKTLLHLSRAWNTYKSWRDGLISRTSHGSVVGYTFSIGWGMKKFWTWKEKEGEDGITERRMMLHFSRNDGNKCCNWQKGSLDQNVDLIPIFLFPLFPLFTGDVTFRSLLKVRLPIPALANVTVVQVSNSSFTFPKSVSIWKRQNHSFGGAKGKNEREGEKKDGLEI